MGSHEKVTGHAGGVAARPDAEARAVQKLAARRLRYVNETGRSEAVQEGVVKGAAGWMCPGDLVCCRVRKKVLEKGSMVKSGTPVGVGERRGGEHGARRVLESPVATLGNAVAQMCVRRTEPLPAAETPAEAGSSTHLTLSSHR